MAILDARQLGLKGDGTAESPPAVAAFDRAMRQLSGQNVVSFPPGLYCLPQSLFVPSNTTFTGSAATLQALAPSTPIFLGDGVSNTAWQGLTLIGLGTDYVNRDSGGSTNACGIKLTGSTGVNTSIRVSGCRVRNFGWAGVFLTGANDLLLEQTTVTGPGSPIIKPEGNNCFGLAIYGTYAKLRLKSCAFSGMATGLLTDHTGSDGEIDDCWFTDIPGQHGIYCDHASGLTVNRCVFRNICQDGVKVQHDLTGKVKDDGANITLTWNSFQGVGGKPIIVANLSPGTHDFYGLVITDNTMMQQGMPDDSIYLRGCRQGQILRNTSLGGRNGIRVWASSDVLAQDNRLFAPLQCGVAIGDTAAGRETFDSIGIQVATNTIQDAAQQGLAGYTFGVGVWSATGVTVQGNTINAGNGRMTAAIAQTQLTDGASLRVVGNHGFGPGLALRGPIAQQQGNQFFSA